MVGEGVGLDRRVGRLVCRSSHFSGHIGIGFDSFTCFRITLPAIESGGVLTGSTQSLDGEVKVDSKCSLV